MKSETEISAEDIVLLYSLRSLEHSLRDSSLEPILIKSDLPSLDGLRTPYSLIYYDVEDHGMGHINRRIKYAADDIKHALNFHGQFSFDFLTLAMNFQNNNRSKIMEITGALCNGVLDYLDFVEKHQRRLMDDFFLYHPTCMPGHYFQFGNFVRELHFNSNQDKAMARQDITYIMELKELFRRRNNPIEIEDTFEFIEYEKNIDLVKKRLHRDFKFSL